MSDPTTRLGLELLSIKPAVDDGHPLTDGQLETAMRGFEEGGVEEAKHAVGILSRGRMTEEVWGATHGHLFDLLERASVGGAPDGELPRAACAAARVVAQTNAETPIDPPVRTALGESLIRDGTGDGGDPWLTAAGTLLVSTAIDAAEYDPPEGIAKRIAEHLLAVSKRTEGAREANLAAAGYGVLGRTSGGDHARTLVARSIDLQRYLLRTEPNLREGFLRFVARLAEDDPGCLEPYTVDLAVHLRAETVAVRRDAARAFAALCGETDWEVLHPGVRTLDGPFENEAPVRPVFALNFLHQVATRDPGVVPERVGDAFTDAVRSDDRFTELYGSAAAAENGVLSRGLLFPVLESLAPRFPALVEAAGGGVFDELSTRDDEDIEPFVAATAGCFAAVDPDTVGETFVRYIADTLPDGAQDGAPDGLPDDGTVVRPMIGRFVARMGEFDAEKALATADRLVALADAAGTPERPRAVGSLLRRADRERDDSELRTNFGSVIERVASDPDSDRGGCAGDVLEGPRG
jgi:hypothetical protein